jgi:hypothetical protein
MALCSKFLGTQKLNIHRMVLFAVGTYVITQFTPRPPHPPSGYPFIVLSDNFTKNNITLENDNSLSQTIHHNS